MSRNQIESLLDRYLKGETTPQENELVERWLEKNGSPSAEWKQLDQSDKERWMSELFDDIHHTIHEGGAIVVHLPQKRRYLWQSIAAAVAMLVISFTLYLEWPILQSRLYPEKLTLLNVPVNQKKQVRLADGSQVWVNAGSELKYPQIFNGKIREVYLSGEAYFDITHNAAKPFLIHTGKVVTTVLGTSFNIKENKSQNLVEVTVTRGKVGISNGNKLLGILTPNQQISFNTSKDEVVKKTIDAQQVIAWQGDLHFDDVSFAAAVSQLQQRFNVKISFSNDKLKNCRFTGTSLDGDKLDKILKVICAFNNATYQTKSDGSILIRGTGCN